MPTLYPWRLSEENLDAWRERLRSFLEAGADGYGVWDGKRRIDEAMDIGLAEPGPLRAPAPPPRERLVTSLNGFRTDRYASIECFRSPGWLPSLAMLA